MPKNGTPVARVGLATLLAVAGTATALPLNSHAAPDPNTPRTVLCDDIGQVQVDKAGGSWKIVGDAPLSVAATGLPCRAVTTNSAGHLKSSGEPVLHVAVDTETVLASADRSIAAQRAKGSRVQGAAQSDPAGYGNVTAFPYQSQLANYLAGRSGNVGVAFRKAGTSTIYSYYKGRKSNVTASIVKMQIMATVMYQAQQKGRGLTSWEKSQLVPMIRVSDNAAATNLYQHVGGRDAVQSVVNRMGLRETTLGPGGYWGLTVTTAPDQVVLVDHFARKNPVLSDGMRDYGLSLMRGASSWGVNQGPGTDIAVKNGWLPRTDGWHVNSVGYNHHSPAYSAAVLTHSASGSLETQKATIAGASRIMYAHRGDGVVDKPTSRPVRGDLTGDRKADAVAINGPSLYLLRGLGSGRLATPARIGRNGWDRMTWIGVPGDVTGDGRSDLVARRTDGTLWLYPSTGSGLGDGRQIGKNWNGVSLLTAVGDIDGNGTPDLLARTSTGRLARYALPRSGGAVAKNDFGSSWWRMVRLMPTSTNGDGRADVLALREDGRLFRYTSQGTALGDGAQVGRGWSTRGTALLSGPGDLDGNGTGDVIYQVGRSLQTYPVRAGGTFMTPRSSGTTISGYRLLA
ncbi:FG-GAP-like repeat-containing protein [Luteococcus sp. H138]|uniref:FG-GAP-like repeat-containing protein n=1 Tax=unclassified Luteococcus TaxID=2639923 RepID=UPI00313E2B3F